MFTSHDCAMSYSKAYKLRHLPSLHRPPQVWRFEAWFWVDLQPLWGSHKVEVEVRTELDSCLEGLGSVEWGATCTSRFPGLFLQTAEFISWGHRT